MEYAGQREGDSVVTRVNARIARRHSWPVVLALAAVCALVKRDDPSVVASAAYFGLIATVIAFFADRYRRTERLAYDLRNTDGRPYSAAALALVELRKARRVWRVVDHNATYDRAHRAGPTFPLRRERVRVAKGDPPFIKANVPIWGLRNRRFGLYFLPDCVLVYHAKRYLTLSYDALRVAAMPTRYVERARRVPSDGIVVERTSSMNSTGPRRAFVLGRRWPVMQYQDLRFRSTTTGVTIAFLVSNVYAAERAAGAFSRLTVLADERRARTAGANGAGGRQERWSGGDRGGARSREEDTRAGARRVARSAQAAAYDTLGLSPGASRDEVRRAFHALAQRYHPDKLSPHLGQEARDAAEAMMKRVTAAYKLLNDQRSGG